MDGNEGNAHSEGGTLTWVFLNSDVTSLQISNFGSLAGLWAGKDFGTRERRVPKGRKKRDGITGESAGLPCSVD